MEQVSRLSKEGYKVVVKYPSIGASLDNLNIVGFHGFSWTPRGIWERYLRLGQKCQRLPEQMGWVSTLPMRFYNRWQQDQSELNFFAFMGMLQGLTGKIETEGEKDFRDYVNFTQFNKIQEFGFPFMKGKKLEVVSNITEIRECIIKQYPSCPKELNIYLNQNCNFACSFCLKSYGGTEKHPYQVLVPILQEVLEKWPQIKGATIAGFGEPLLSEHLGSVLQFLKEKGLFIGLITNGSLILDRLEILREHTPNYVSVSMNAAAPEEHRKITGTYLYSKVLSGIDWLVNESIPTTLSFVVTRQNIESIPDFLALAKWHGIKNVVLHNILPHSATTGDDSVFWNQVLLQSDIKVIDLLEKYKQHEDSGLVSHWPVLISKDSSKNPLHCNSPFVSIGVDGSGFTTGCRRVMPPSAEWTHYSNALCWISVKYLELRQQLCGELVRNPLCDMCFGNWGEKP